ncbi:MAG: M3 family oligoendopeptidase [Peptostreptococcus sp.]|uniref:M3 family oligoendopeptidase n=1 Tax=Peptostreptococcus sp. TaxID=1262 RepID=UPI002FC90BE5
MNFNDIEYERVNYEYIRKQYMKILHKIENSTDFSRVKSLIRKLNVYRKTVLTMNTVASIRFSINTNDEFYKAEKKYWDEYSPLFSDLDIDFYRVLLNSNFEEELKNEFGEQFYRYIKTLLDSFSKEIIVDLQEENLLMSEYTSLLASAKIDFDNRVCNLSDMSIYTSSNDENIRKNAIKAHTKFFEDNEEKFDELFDKLVKNRDKMAKKMGFDNFIELGYLLMNRTDYNAKMVSNLRENVIKKYVPLANELYRQQADRINVNKMTYYDEQLEFLDGNAKVVGDGNYIMEQGRKMYSEMSKETDEFINFLLKNNLFDVEARQAKAMGGYCSIVYDYNEPFIFGNFNGTVDDVDVLTHEAGHAFQVYMSRGEEMPELVFPTLDSCEIFSMSMEFFTYPWMDLFFAEDTEKYKKYHYDSAIKFLPYGALVDHFQHEIYAHPEYSPSRRKEIWRNLEKIYLPHREYSDLEFLERGGFWFRQGHIFKNPFYYIDYVLAQICALQFHDLMKVDREDAWNRYLEISKLGGRYSFLELVDIAKLENPFE